MNEVDRRAPIAGPDSANDRSAPDAHPPVPAPPEQAALLAQILSQIDGRLAAGVPASAPGPRPTPTPARAAAGSPPPPPDHPGDEYVKASFPRWASLSARLLHATADERHAALAAAGVAPATWAHLDAACHRLLSEDVRAGRPERPALYAAACEAERARRAEPPPALPPVLRARPALTGTDLAHDLPPAAHTSMAKLPFVPPEAVPPPPPGRAVARTARVPVTPSAQGKTMPLDTATLCEAIAAVAPFAGSPATVVPFPTLTVQQYVSLRMDLTTRPDEAAETCRRYGVPSEASLRALDHDWQRRMTEQPALRAEVHAAAETYLGWLRGWGTSR